MTSIGAIGLRIVPRTEPVRSIERESNSAVTPTPQPIDRVDKLTRQLDASLTNRLAAIRERISANPGARVEASPISRRLDISA